MDSKLDDLIAGEQAYQARRVYRLVRLAVMIYLLIAGVLAGRMLH